MVGFIQIKMNRQKRSVRRKTSEKGVLIVELKVIDGRFVRSDDIIAID